MARMTKWNGPEVERLIRERSRRNIESACILVRNDAVRNVATGGLSGLHVRSGTLKRSIGHDVISPVEGRVGSNLKYARIHELGGVTRPTVTAKMRRWAWAMLRETGNRLYAGIALTRKQKLEVHIPARPYLRPALDNNLAQIRRILTTGMPTK